MLQLNKQDRRDRFERYITMTTTISDLTNSTNLDGLLKKVYLPTLQKTAYDDVRLTQLIRTETIPGGGNHIVHFAHTQRAEGVGGISEGGNWVDNVPVKGKQMIENVKYFNAYLALTGPVIDAAKEGPKSAVSVVTDSFRSLMRSYKNNFDRMLMGDQSGYVGRVSAISAGTSITVTNSSYPLAPYFADMFMPIGAILESGTFASTGLNSTGHNNSASGVYPFYVVSRLSQDLDNGTSVMVLASDTAGTVYNEGGNTNVEVGDFFFRKGAYGTAATSAVTWANNLEMNGISNLISDGLSNSETNGNYTTIWGKNRTDSGFWYLQSLLKDFSDVRLDQNNLTAFMMDMQFSRQANPNLLLTSPKAERMFFNEEKDNRRFNSVGPMDFVGGYKRMGIQLGEWQLILTSLGSCPSGTLMILDTNDFAFVENRPMHWRLGDGGSVLVQSHTGDNQFATLVHYVNFVCFNPYIQGKGYGVKEE